MCVIISVLLKFSFTFSVLVLGRLLETTGSLALLAVTIPGESLSAGQLGSKTVCPHSFQVFPLCISINSILSGLAWPYLVTVRVMGVWIPVMAHGGLAHTDNGAKLEIQLTLLQVPGG